MRNVSLLAAIAFSVSSAAAMAESSSPLASPETPAKEKKICRNLGVKTDTRIGGGVRKCKTAAEWAQFDSTVAEGRVQSTEGDAIRRTRINGAD